MQLELMESDDEAHHSHLRPRPWHLAYGRPPPRKSSACPHPAIAWRHWTGCGVVFMTATRSRELQEQRRQGRTAASALYSGLCRAPRPGGENYPLRLVEVARQRVGGFRSFIRFNQRQNMGVHFDVGHMQVFGVVQQVERQSQLGGDMAVEGVEPLAVGQFDDGGVKRHVGGADAHPVAALTADARLFHRLAHFFHRRMHGIRPGQRLALHQTSHPVDIHDGGHVRRGDKYPAVRLMFQQ